MIVRNGKGTTGIDWRAVAALVAALCTVIGALLLYGGERETFSAHVDNRGEWRHLTQDERDEMLVGTRYELRAIRAQLTAIARQIGVPSAIEPAIVPRGQED